MNSMRNEEEVLIWALYSVDIILYYKLSSKKPKPSYPIKFVVLVKGNVAV